MFAGTLQYQKKDASQQQGKHLWTYAPSWSRSCSTPQREYPRNVGTARAAHVNRPQTDGNDGCERHDQSSPSRQTIHRVHRDLREPLMIDPRLACTSKGVGIQMRNLMIFEYQLTGTQMPPYIRIGYATRG